MQGIPVSGKIQSNATDLNLKHLKKKAISMNTEMAEEGMQFPTPALSGSGSTVKPTAISKGSSQPGLSKLPVVLDWYHLSLSLPPIYVN